MIQKTLGKAIFCLLCGKIFVFFQKEKLSLLLDNIKSCYPPLLLLSLTNFFFKV